MLPHESAPSFSSSSDEINEMPIKFDADSLVPEVEVRLEFKEEPEQDEEEEEILHRLSQFLKEPDELSTNSNSNGSDFDTEMVELKYEPSLNESDQDQNPAHVNTPNKIITPNTNISTRSSSVHHNDSASNSNSDLKCDKEFSTRRRLTIHEQNHNKEYNCALCDYKGKAHLDLKTHLRTHTKKRVWKCPEPNCIMSFLRKAGLERHHLSRHAKKPEEEEEDPKVFRCSRCPFQTLSELAYTVHAESFHVSRSVRMKIKCPHKLCPYKCTFQSSLFLHMRTAHSQKRPFKCPLTPCKVAAKTREFLIRHLSIYHFKTGEEIKSLVNGDEPIDDSSSCSVSASASQHQVQNFPPSLFLSSSSSSSFSSASATKVQKQKTITSQTEELLSTEAIQQYAKLVDIQHKSSSSSSFSSFNSSSAAGAKGQRETTSPGQEKEEQEELLSSEAIKLYAKFVDVQHKSRPVVKSCRIFYHCVNLDCDFYTQDESQLAAHLSSEHQLPRVILQELPQSTLKTWNRKENKKSSLHLPPTIKRKFQMKEVIPFFNCSEPTCSFKSATQENVYFHEFSRHGIRGNVKIYSCPYEFCRYETPRKESVKFHVDSVHRHLKNFHCDLCEIKTTTQKNLQRHIDQVHRNLRPFKCPEMGCGYAAKTKVHLERHLQSIHQHSILETKNIV